MICYIRDMNSCLAFVCVVSLSFCCSWSFFVSLYSGFASRCSRFSLLLSLWASPSWCTVRVSFSRLSAAIDSLGSWAVPSRPVQPSIHARMLVHLRPWLKVQLLLKINCQICWERCGCLQVHLPDRLTSAAGTSSSQTSLLPDYLPSQWRNNIQIIDVWSFCGSSGSSHIDIKHCILLSILSRTFHNDIARAQARPVVTHTQTRDAEPSHAPPHLQWADSLCPE